MVSQSTYIRQLIQRYIPDHLYCQLILLFIRGPYCSDIMDLNLTVPGITQGGTEKCLKSLILNSDRNRPLEFYDRITVHRNRFLMNETNN